MFDYAERRRRLAERMREAGVDLLFLPPSSDLEYLTGVERGIPTFGQSQYAHGWVAGAFFRPDRDPVFVLPRMMTLFELAGELPGELVGAAADFLEVLKMRVVPAGPRPDLDELLEWAGHSSRSCGRGSRSVSTGP